MARRKHGQELTIRKIREILRLGLQCGLSNREISRSCNVSRSTVGKYINTAQKASITYLDTAKMDNRQLKEIFKQKKSISISKPQPDWAYIHQEKKKKGVTLILLWQEYKEIHPEGYQSTQFCEHYHQWRKKLKVSLRQTYKAGEKMFVDYAGQTVPIYNRVTGKITEASIFVI